LLTTGKAEQDAALLDLTKHGMGWQCRISFSQHILSGEIYLAGNTALIQNNFTKLHSRRRATSWYFPRRRSTGEGNISCLQVMHMNHASSIQNKEG
jgi:hypothetical protein